MLRFKALIFAAIAALCTLPALRAVENTWDYSVQVSAVVQSSPPRITLSWPQDTNSSVSNYTVYRKSPTDTSWGGGTSLSGTATTYVDNNVADGGAYEYRVSKTASGYSGQGYIRSGINVPLVDQRGKIVLVVDNTMSAPLATELARLQQDLSGDGWVVLRHDVSRSDSPVNVKALIKADYAADPTKVKAVFLFGHVPVPYSGKLSADSHPDHIGAWPADVYYGDMDGTWTDSSVDWVQTGRPDAEDNARLSNRPGDGKFDQNTPPSPVELEIGRVDLQRMSNADYWGIDAVFPTETEALRRYLNKDHNFRFRVTNPDRRALIGDYIGLFNGIAPAQVASRNFAPLVGSNNIRNLNIEYNDQRGVWINASADNSYLFAYGGAPAGYGAISGLGSAGPSFGAPVAEFLSRDVRNIVTIFWGSYIADWDHWDNVLRAPLLNNHGLVTLWSGRTDWNLHSLGMGETFGHSARLSQNDNGLYDGGAKPIWVALMGDPTLRIHPVVPVVNLTGSINGSTVALQWSASTDSNIVGYHVYRAPNPDATATYTRLTTSPVTSLDYSDAAGSQTAVYMVRAIKRETSPSGSYFNPSQGLFWSPTGGSLVPTPAPLPPTTLDTTPPAISVTAPSAGATVSGAAVSVTANAFDNTGVLGVQFILDGANLGFEDTTAPYGVTLNSTTLTNGTHSLTAIARDAAGNTATSASVSFTVSNAESPTAGGAPPPANGTETVYFDDAIPINSTPFSDGGDAWNWVTANPTPFSGTKAHQSAAVAGLHTHSFNWGGTMSVGAGDRLYAYVYLDPANMPAEIMIGWCADSWEHRAYWGADRIAWGTNGTAGRYYAGALPAPGGWIRLEIPAAAVGLEGQTVRGMTFALVDGRATWDRTGTVLAGSVTTATTTTTTTTPTTTTTTTPTATTTTTTTTTTPTTTTGSDFVWLDDALPVDAVGTVEGGDAWNWVTANPAPAFGTKSHQSNNVAGIHSHGFGWGATMTVLVGDILYAYVYIDPATPPRQIMLSWRADSWEHRAYWGADLINWGSSGTTSRYYAGGLPTAGQWVRLEVPARAVGLEGQVISAMTFTQFDGRATWDRAGTAPAGATAPTTTTPTTTTTTTPTATTTTTTTTTTPTTTTGSDFVWLDDALPVDAVGTVEGGDAWNWVTANPAPAFGSKSHQSNNVAGIHSHGFGWGATMTVLVGDILYAYVYIDPASPPRQIMLSWRADSWEHRAYWGADLINWGSSGTTSRYYAGGLPTAGQWVRLEVPARAVGLEGQVISAMTFTQFDGRATWDRAGTAPAAATAPTTTTPTTTTTTTPTTTTTTTTPTATTTTGSDFVWLDDALPAGATGTAEGGDAWNWVTASPVPAFGAKAHQSTNVAGILSHGFNWGATMTVLAGDNLYAYVYIDPASSPREIMLSWSADNWEHRAYWGANLVNWGNNGQAGRYYAGSLPAAGQWVRLEVPARAVGLEDQVVKAMTFTQYDGRATWDRSGTAPAGAVTTTTPTTTTSPTTTTTTTTPPVTTTASIDTFVWFDDAIPDGATGIGIGTENWNWVTSGPTPFSGTRAHQSIAAAGLHEHYFAWGATMAISAGDKLFAYVYLDPANPPTEIMLSWSDGSWEHRAYWGADRIPYGQAGTAGRYYAGSLPATGQWVRLEVPASAVGLEGTSVHAMSFSTFDGRVTYDRSGKGI